MKIKFWLKNDKYVAGITMRDEAEAENGNMALHTGADAKAALENRRKLASFLGRGIEDFVCAYQTHSANYHKATAADRGRGSVAMENAIPDTDALYTFEPGLLLCCFTADCVPLIFYSERTGLIGVIHSGWGGTVREIVPKVLEHLKNKEGISISDMRVFIGPAISQEKFEVDEDVRDRFAALGYADEFICYNKLTHKYHIDNQLVVRKQCELHGILPENISVDRTCTCTGSECFSWRRDKNRGRHVSFIMRKR